MPNLDNIVGATSAKIPSLIDVFSDEVICTTGTGFRAVGHVDRAHLYEVCHS